MLSQLSYEAGGIFPAFGLICSGDSKFLGGGMLAWTNYVHHPVHCANETEKSVVTGLRNFRGVRRLEGWTNEHLSYRSSVISECK